jgi:hypothetical protein
MLPIIEVIERLRSDVTWKDDRIVGSTFTRIAESYQSSQFLLTRQEIENNSRYIVI